LPEDQIGIAAFPHAQADADIHLGADGAFAHGLLAWPLSRGDQVDRGGPAAPGGGIGAVVGFLGHFGVFVHDDDQGRLIGGGLPDALAFSGHLRGPLVKPAHGIAEQFVGLVLGCGEPGKAWRPGSEFGLAMGYLR
jgi:hypothetical protein